MARVGENPVQSRLNRRSPPAGARVLEEGEIINDGDLHWNSMAIAAASFSEAMTGHVAVMASNLSAACDFNVQLAVTPAQVSYTGMMCGYDVQLLLQP